MHLTSDKFAEIDVPMCLVYDYCFKARKKMKYLYSIKIYQ
jgi:hypothetical protein